jgi:hypothetical protein
LDIPTAMAIHFDVVRKTNGETMYGYVDWPPAGWQICGPRYSREKIAQVSLRSTKANVALFAEDSMNFFDCSLEPAELRDVRFYPIVESDLALSFGQRHPLDRADIESITFCKLSACIWPGALSGN